MLPQSSTRHNVFLFPIHTEGGLLPTAPGADRKNEEVRRRPDSNRPSTPRNVVPIPGIMSSLFGKYPGFHRGILLM